ncbi:uncharacterized protein LOC108259991 isoform X2 [Ictalurus punctatus]|uniref:Uncharacterized protein LOC108259991 isoform X2 n=1 Tax=Ictalurus punctatus TaxID=7998 RepID=A0A2D0Q9J6_ICTPU|nr:uncharacterized protein LOC108259991 isoform X2 [Ictalurus punctatus]
MMEMQQRTSMQMNEYDNPGEPLKTEDIYQSLQTLPTVAARNVSDYHFRQSAAEVLNDQKTNQEMWYLHAEMFYLFWTDQGDCHVAERFCAKRKANLVTVTKSNTDWLKSQTNGKRMLVRMSQLHSSGDGLESFLSMGEDADDESDCELFGVTSDLSEQVEGWVCEKAAQRLNYTSTM